MENLFKLHPILEKQVNKAIKMLIKCFSNKHKLLVCGNGGSAADALHVVGELRKNFQSSSTLNKEIINNLIKLFPNDADMFINNLQNAFPVISLVNEISLITAIANDISGEFIFAQQLIGLGQKKDALLIISTSGNSVNIIHAAKIAKCLDMIVIALTGKDKNELSLLADVTIHAPEIITYKIQELHIKIYHYICMEIEKNFLKKDRL